MRSILQRGVVGLVAAGALLAGGLGVGTASAATVDQAGVPAAQAASWHPRDFCDNWGNRWDRRCARSDRWYWDGHGHRWTHWRWDGHRWYHRW